MADVQRSGHRGRRGVNRVDALALCYGYEPVDARAGPLHCCAHLSSKPLTDGFSGIVTMHSFPTDLFSRVLGP